MDISIFMLIMFIVPIYLIYTISYQVCYFTLSFLNPIRNYHQWTSFNWLGIITITLILNILWLPYAIIYWLYKVIYFIFTIGRRN